MDYKQQLNFDVRIIGIEVCFNYSDNEILSGLSQAAADCNEV